ncbi:MAG: R3H domain-containing nucleic acid-binding protein [Chloroflexota bacterium]
MESQEGLLEIVLDLGRRPEARFQGRETFLSDEEVSPEDLEYVVSRIGQFGDDNRAGIPRTLHRISAIRNRRGAIVGLTCRVGRSVLGTVDIIRDLVEGGRSVLILGRPGVGKTTLLREVARVLADELGKRVIVVDTSNEIAGDGDIPHPGIGRARRMQVPTPREQHGVMIEAVENHMPEVIVIDEIGTELEAEAARTIAERGVQLVGTAHGNSLENLLMNPTLSDLVGGVQPVTLGDEEARRRGTQKTVLERKAPPTFDVLVEMRTREHVAVHRDVAETVDAALRGAPAAVEVRTRHEDGTVDRRLEVPGAPGVQGRMGDDRGRRNGSTVERGERRRARERWTERSGDRGDFERAQPADSPATLQLGPAGQPDDGEEEEFEEDESVDGTPFNRFRRRPGQALRPVKLYPYGVNRDRLEAAVASLRLPVTITKEMRDADVVMTLKNYYRKSPGPVRDAEDVGKPVFILRSNTINQIQQSLEALYGMETADPVRDIENLIVRDTEDAISQVLQTHRPVELPPQNAYIRRLQHQLAERANLRSRSMGWEPQRRVRLFRHEADR